MPDPHSLEPTGSNPLEQTRRSSAWRWVWLTVALAFLAALACGGYLWYRTITLPDRAWHKTQEIVAVFAQKLHFTPEVHIDAKTVFTQDTPVFQLVTMTRHSLVRYHWDHTWLGSTKQLEIAAIFTAQAGFDLRAPFRIRLDSRTGQVKIDLPPPAILSMGFTDVQVLSDEDGYWNKLTADERQQAFHALEAEARRQFEASSLLNEARLEGEKRVRALLAPSNPSEITFAPPPEKK